MDPFCPRQVSFTIPGAPGVQVTATENAGMIDFAVDVLNTSLLTGDLRGLFFHFNEAKLASLHVIDTDGLITKTAINANKVLDLGNGDNMNGAASPFDVGVGFGNQGIGKGDDINYAVHFSLADAANDLALDDFAGLLFGARVTSIGNPAKPQARNDSEKITFIAPAAPHANGDTFSIFEDGAKGFDDPSKTPTPVACDVLANDTDADTSHDQLIITGFHDGPSHGTVQVSADGHSVLYTPFLDYSGSDSFEYCISDQHGGQDHSTANVSIAAVADTPLLTWTIAAGPTAYDILINVTATQNDADGSEFIDRIDLGGPPAGVTVDTLSFNPADDPSNQFSLSHQFVVSLPHDTDTKFDLLVTDVSEETSDGDTEANAGTIPIELEFNHSTDTENFALTNQSIWDNDIPPVDDDRFIGFDDGFNKSADFIVPTIPPTLVDASVDFHLKAGFQSTLHFDGGEIDANVPFDITIDTAYNKTTNALLLTPTAALGSGGGFTTTGPEGFYKLYFLFDLLLHPSVTVDGIDIPDIFEIELNPDPVKLIDLESNSPDLPFKVPLPLGLSVSFDWPHISTTGSQNGPDTLGSSGASNNFLELGLDIDQLAATFFPLLAPIDPDPTDDSNFEWLDLDVSGGINFLQNFLLNASGLGATLTLEDGTMQPFAFGTPLTILDASSHDITGPGGTPDGEIDFDLALILNATLRNQTDLGFNVGYSLDLLKNIPIVDETLYHNSGTFPIGSIGVYDNTFALTFPSQDFQFDTGGP